MKKILLMILILLLTGCGSNKEITKTCKIEHNNIKSELVLYGDNDVLIQTSETMYIPYSVLSIHTNEDKDYYKELIEQAYTGFKGVVVSVSLESDELVLNLVIDYANVSNEDLISLGLLHESDSDIQFVSVSKSLQVMENQGYICK